MGAKRNTGDRRRYNKPPAQHQFAKGQSGNPGGRSKGSRNLKTLVEEVLMGTISMRQDGRSVTVPLAQALLLKEAQAGLAGNLNAIDRALNRLNWAQEEEHPDPEDAATPDTHQQDSATLARYRDQITRQTAAGRSLDAHGAATADPDTDNRHGDAHAETDADTDALPEGPDHA